MMSLQQLLPNLNLPANVAGIVVSGLQLDSRQVQSGQAFVAVPGVASDGRRFVSQAVAAGAAAAVRHLKTSGAERAAHQARVATVRAALDARGIPHLANDSHIIPVMVGDPVKCKFISDKLLQDFGIYIQPINYPTVPKGTERLRITPSPVHSAADIDHLVGALARLWTQCELARLPLAAE